MSRRIALASHRQLPAEETDDHALEAALRARGATVETPAWDDPAVDWSAYDLVVPRTTWNYTERYPDFLAWAEAVGAVSRLVNPLSVIRWNTDKSYLAALPVPQAPTRFLPAGQRPDLAAWMDVLGATQALLKPVVGAGGYGSLRFSRSTVEAGEEHVARAPVDQLLQPYLPSVERFGEVSAIYFGGAFSHAVRKRPVPGSYLVQSEHGASDEPHVLSPAERALCEQTLAAAAARWPEPLAYARVDLLHDDAGAPLCNELELVEPSLFFRHDPASADRFAAVLMGW